VIATLFPTALAGVLMRASGLGVVNGRLAFIVDLLDETTFWNYREQVDVDVRLRNFQIL
jgi:hypothetical protein